MLYMMGFIAPEPPKLGSFAYNIEDIHLTYINYAEIPLDRIPGLLNAFDTVVSQHEPIPFELESEMLMFGVNNDIPARRITSALQHPHRKLNAALEIAAMREGAILHKKYEYSAHISNTAEPLTGTVKHLSAIYHEGEIGVNTKNLANFTLGYS